MRLIVPFSGADRRKCIDFYLRNINLGDRGYAPEAKAIYDYDELESSREYQRALEDFYNISIFSAVLDNVNESLEERSYHKTRDRVSEMLTRLKRTYQLDDNRWPERFIDKFDNLDKQVRNIETSHAGLIRSIIDEILEYELCELDWVELDLTRQYIVIAGAQNA